MQNQVDNVQNKKSEPYCILPQLPYSFDALEPVISAKSLEFHYGKHHKGYVDKTNKLIKNTEFETKSLEEVIQSADGPLYNNAAQVWNHTFFWNCLTPASQGLNSGNLFESIEKAFGSFDEFKKQFTNKGVSLFGSGYVWLVANKQGELSIKTGKNAYNPLVDELIPLLTCDVWEHAYYLDYQNKRDEFLTNFWKIVNWDFVQSKFKLQH